MDGVDKYTCLCTDTHTGINCEKRKILKECCTGKSTKEVT